MANRRGIPRIEANGSTTSITAINYTFTNRGEPLGNYNGLIIFKLPDYTAPSSGTPAITFADEPVTDFSGVPLTSATFTKGGIFIAFYDGSSFKILSNY